MVRKLNSVEVIIHRSQHPERVRRDLVDGLARGAVSAKFLYETRVQAAKWVAVHQAYSPACHLGSNVASIYRAAGVRAAADLRRVARDADIIGLGCGSGHKEAAIVRALVPEGARESRLTEGGVRFIPADVSVPLILGAVLSTAEATGLSVRDSIRPVIVDLEHAGLAGVVDCCEGFLRDNSPRLVTFFGMLPNMRHDAVTALVRALRPGDLLLLGANLICNNPDPESVTRVLSQYDNPPTADWLWAFMESLGVDRSQGQIRFSAAADPGSPGWIRVRGDFEATRDFRLVVEGESVEFLKDRPVNVFFSRRPSPDQMIALIRSSNLELMDSWISENDGEGVYYCRAATAE